ncbi:MAG: hypothetical protein ACM37W_04990 [Actinomycetota bacterium]
MANPNVLTPHSFLNFSFGKGGAVKGSWFASTSARYEPLSGDRFSLTDPDRGRQEQPFNILPPEFCLLPLVVNAPTPREVVLQGSNHTDFEAFQPGFF